MFTFFNIYDKLNNNLKGENTVQTLNTYNFSERTLKKLSQFLEIRKTYIDKFIKKELNI